MMTSTATVPNETNTISQSQSTFPSPPHNSELSSVAQSNNAEENIESFVQHLLEKLEEENIQLTKDVVTYLGIEQSKKILEQTFKIEKRGGMGVNNGQRRRTKGGVFFYLVKQNMPEEGLEKIFPPYAPQFTPEEMKEQRRSQRIGKKILLQKEVTEAWESRLEPVKEILQSKELGQSNNMRVTLIGRPGQLRNQSTFIMTTMQAPNRSPSLPRELPNAPDSNLVYLVCIGQKQWRKVEKAIRNPEDMLIIEGYLTYQKELKKMAVFAQMVTTKVLQQKLRESQRAKAEEEASQK